VTIENELQVMMSVEAGGKGAVEGHEGEDDHVAEVTIGTKRCSSA